MTMRSLAIVTLATGVGSLAHAQLGSISLRTNELVYDRVRNKIYGSVPGSVPIIGNSIVVIDPISLEIEGTTWVGSDPNAMALSGSCQTLYVSLDGSGRIVEYDVETHTIVRSFVVGSAPPHGPMYAFDIEVAPGSDDTIAVARDFLFAGSARAGVAIFKNGTLLPNFDIDAESMVIDFGSSASRLYGGDGGSDFQRYEVDELGVTLLDSVSLSGFSLGQDLIFFRDRVVGRSGRAIEPEPFPAPLGIYPASGEVEPDLGNDYVYILSRDNASMITVCNIETFAAVRTIPLTPTGTPESFLRWGTSGIAYNTDEHIHIQRTSQLWRQLNAGAQTLGVVPGSIIQGNLASLLSSDDDKLVMVPGAVFSTGQAPVRLTLNFTAPEQADDLSLTFESAASSASVNMTISFLNHATGAYEQIALQACSTVDTVSRFDVFDRASDFIHPTSSEVSVRVEFKAVGPVFSYPWQARVDLARLVFPDTK